MTTDSELLASYAATGSPEAFAGIVERHTPMVFSACLRVLGDRQAAEDAAQATFLVLVRKARGLRAGTALAGWLYLAARNAAGDARKLAARRARHEKEAAEMRARTAGAEPASWEQLRPALDAALAALPGGEREAVVQRYLCGRSPAEAARELQISEDALAKRLTRALAGLRARLLRQDAALPAAAFGPLLAARAVEAVPAGLAGTIGAVCTGQAAASPAVLAMTKGALKMMFWAKVKLAAAVFLGAALVAGGGGVAVRMAAGEPEKPREAPKAEKKLNPQVLALADNTWLKMGPPKEPDGRNYSSPIWGDGKIFYFGGAHFSYNGNDVAIYDLAANAWTRSYEPEMRPEQKFDGKTTVGDVLSPKTGRPWPLHTYQQWCWVPDRKVCFWVSGTAGTWQFDPAKLEWTHLHGKYHKDEKKQFSPNTPIAHQTMHCFYSPELKAPVVHQTSSPFVNYKYDFDKGEWAKLAKGIPAKHKWAEPYSTHVPPLGVQLISQANEPHMWTYNAVTEEWKPVADVPVALRGCQALAWDAANKVVLAMGSGEKSAGGKSVAIPWVLDPATMKWTEQKAANAGPEYKAAWAPLWYDPDHNACFFLNRTGQAGCETWVYRYKKAENK